MKQNLAVKKKKKKRRYIIFSQCLRVDYADISVRSGQTYKRKNLLHNITHSYIYYWVFLFWLYLNISSLSLKIM